MSWTRHELTGCDVQFGPPFAPRWPLCVSAVIPVLRRLLMVVVALIASAASVRAEPPAPELFAKQTPLRDFKLSPDARHVAALSRHEKASAVAIFTFPELMRVGGAVLEDPAFFLDFHWSGNGRLIAELGRSQGRLDSPSSTGELVGFDLHGKDFRYLIGQHRDRGFLGRVWASVADPLVDDPDHVLVTTQAIVAARAAISVLSKMNLRTARLEELAVAPEAGDAEFLLDHQGRVRYVTVSNVSVPTRSWAREGKRWVPLRAPEIATDGTPSVLPLAFSADDTALFVMTGEFGPTRCLARIELASGVRHRLACHDRVDLARTLDALVPGGEPVAAVFEPGMVDVAWFDSRHPDQVLMRDLVSAFPNKEIAVASASRDGRIAIIRVGDDRSSGDYYLFDAVSKQAHYFLGDRTWLDPEQMGERRPIRLNARDGTPLHGYLTMPPGSTTAPPLVVIPHGGPLDVRDHWRFDDDAQMLATHGYAVLQVNFRGSGGYGPAFRAAGHRAWASAMIDDIEDATSWVVEQRMADGGRVCIAGASYGAFAALTSAVRPAARFRCVIAEAGVYDLELLRRDSDITDDWRGRAYFATAIAADRDAARASSPIHRLQDLKAPVLIIHGEADQRAPFAQARALRKALVARGAPHAWLAEAGEGHGFAKEASQARRNRAIVDFLARHLPAAGPEPASVPPSATDAGP